MTKAMQVEIIAFVASVFCGATEGREPICWKTADETIAEWRKAGIELPKGLTPYYYQKYWNEFCNADTYTEEVEA